MYFLLVSNDERYTQARVKIGHTGKNLSKRIKEHKSDVSRLGGIAPHIEEICAIHGTKGDESVIHRYFADLSAGNDEVFHPEEKLCSYIRWLRDQWFTWCPDDELCESFSNIEAVDSSLWLPREDRKKARPYGLFPSFGPLNLGTRIVTGDDYYTSKTIIECVRALFGCIDLDPASHAVANRVVQARRFYTLADDGLSRTWSGKVWLNPPFSQWEKWAYKILLEQSRGEISELCLLATTRTITAKYFYPIMQGLNAFCVIRGRIPFWGTLAGTPDDGHAIIYFGKRVKEFKTCFQELGNIFTHA